MNNLDSSQSAKKFQLISGPGVLGTKFWNFILDFHMYHQRLKIKFQVGYCWDSILFSVQIVDFWAVLTISLVPSSVHISPSNFNKQFDSFNIRQKREKYFKYGLLVFLLLTMTAKGLPKALIIRKKNLRDTWKYHRYFQLLEWYNTVLLSGWLIS